MQEDFSDFSSLGNLGINPENIQRMSQEKQLRRKEFLKAHPEKRIRVSREALIQIMPTIQHFYCARESSAFLDSAIEGSDIDGGIIIVEKRDKQKENKVIEELQRQGFNVSHHDDDISEVTEIWFMTQDEFDERQQTNPFHITTEREVWDYKD